MPKAKQESIQAENGYVCVNWYHGGMESWFGGLDKLKLEELRMLDTALQNADFMEDFMAWVRKQQFVNKLHGHE